MSQNPSLADFLQAKAALRKVMLRNWIIMGAATALGLYCIVEQLAVLGTIAAIMVADAAYLNGRMQGMLDLTDGPE